MTSTPSGGRGDGSDGPGGKGDGSPAKGGAIGLKLAVRNLLRHRWRSALTLGGIAVAVGLMVWTIAFYDGWMVALVRGGTAVETGQLQIQSARYARDGRIYQSFPVDDALLDAVAGVAGVRAVAPRVVGHGLVGNERRSRVARILGVDPVREAAATPVADAVEAGRWLSAEPRGEGSPAEAVLGVDLARQLQVGPGDELVVFLEAADGSLGNDLLEVVGTVRTGNTGVDRMGVYIPLVEARITTALEGEANTVVVRTDDLTTARETADSVAAALRVGGPDGPGGAAGVAPGEVRIGAPGDDEEVAEATLSVRPWQEILPGLDQMILIMDRSSWIMYVVIYLVAAVGILNTQRMSALERRREFGVLLALGFRPRRMFGIVQVETAVLGLAGALLGAALGGALAWYHATAGFDLGLMADDTSFTWMGVAFSERLHFVLSPRALLQPLLVMLGVALLSGLWPSVTAARIEPAPTIAGRGA